jgi:hypothetical protein
MSDEQQQPDKPYFDFFTLGEAQAILKGLEMVYPMLSMMRLHAEVSDKDEKDFVADRLQDVINLIKRMQEWPGLIGSFPGDNDDDDDDDSCDCGHDH